MDEALDLELLVFDVFLLGNTYRLRSESRSKAVTEALKLFLASNKDNTFPITILRTRAKTHQVNPEAESVDIALAKVFTKTGSGC